MRYDFSVTILDAHAYISTCKDERFTLTEILEYRKFLNHIHFFMNTEI